MVLVDTLVEVVKNVISAVKSDTLLVTVTNRGPEVLVDTEEDIKAEVTVVDMEVGEGEDVKVRLVTLVVDTVTCLATVRKVKSAIIVSLVFLVTILLLPLTVYRR